MWCESSSIGLAAKAASVFKLPKSPHPPFGHLLPFCFAKQEKADSIVFARCAIAQWEKVPEERMRALGLVANGEASKHQVQKPQSPHQFGKPSCLPCLATS